MFQSDEVSAFLVERCKHPQGDWNYAAETWGSVDAWRETVRGRVAEVLQYAPPPVELCPQVVEEVDFGTYVRRKVVYQSAPSCSVPAYLLVPKELDAPAPAVIALHDHSGRYFYGKEKLVDHKAELPLLPWFQRYRYGGRGYASALAEQGYVVLCPDALAWGDRRFLDVSWLGPTKEDLRGYTEGTEEYVFAFDEMWSGCEPRLMDAISFAGATFPGILAWDDRQSLRYLRGLPEVDTARIGCVGLSMGGYRAAFLAALEPDIRCTCIAGYLPRFEDITPRRCPVGWGVPGLYNHLSYPDLVALIAPRALMALNCENDSLFDLATMEKAAGRVAEVYGAAAADDQFTAKGFPVGHQFGLAMQEAAFAWMDLHLRG